MEKFLQQSQAMHTELVKNRRFLHRFSEVGFKLLQTKKFVFRTLTEYGYQPEYVGKAGVVATIGKPGKTILLRADMDALPMREESQLDYAAENGNCHACGHDMHTAMLLGAAKLLKQHEKDLAGAVKLMFQPAEELMSGALDMIEHGILKNPYVDAALALHVMVGREDSQTGKLLYTKGCVSKSGDAIRITVTGKDAHGSTPCLGIDAVSIATHIVIALQEISAREIPSDENTVLLVGKIEGGTTCNTVAGKAVLEVSVRTCGQRQRTFLRKRIKEVATGIALAYRGKAVVEHLYGCSALENNSELVDDMVRYIREIRSEDMIVGDCRMSYGEDFTSVAEQVPSAYLVLGAGAVSEGYPLGLHNPAVKFNEEVLSVGAAIYAGCAYRWLAEH